MDKYTIDTNVLIASNMDNTADHLTIEQQVACYDFLKSVYDRAIICIDSSGEILDEYFRNVSRSGVPGFGDSFARWLYENQFYENKCHRADIRYDSSNPKLYDNFPEHPDLQNFDKSDRKFVCVSAFYNKEPIICNASDSDWKVHLTTLGELGFTLKNLI